MKVLVFGAGGQIGREVCRAAWPPRYAVLPLDENAVDITKSAAVTAMLARETPDLAINLAAYTAVDRAESEPEAAWAVNCAGAAHIAAACDESATPLIQLLTDYVFDGRKAEAYLEDDAVSPLNVAVIPSVRHLGQPPLDRQVRRFTTDDQAFLGQSAGQRNPEACPQITDKRSTLPLVCCASIIQCPGCGIDKLVRCGVWDQKM
jgi:hypothetical protein